MWSTHCNRLDCDTSGMVIVPIANMARCCRCCLDTCIRPAPAHTPVRIAGKVSPTADGSCKLWFGLDGPIASAMSLLGNRNSYRDHCRNRTQWHLMEIARVKWSLSVSTHVVGSSRNITVGLFINSNAIDSRFLWPPDKRLAGVFWWSYRRSSVKISSIYERVEVSYELLSCNDCIQMYLLWPLFRTIWTFCRVWSRLRFSCSPTRLRVFGCDPPVWYSMTSSGMRPNFECDRSRTQPQWRRFAGIRTARPRESICRHPMAPWSPSTDHPEIFHWFCAEFPLGL